MKGADAIYSYCTAANRLFHSREQARQAPWHGTTVKASQHYRLVVLGAHGGAWKIVSKLASRSV